VFVFDVLACCIVIVFAFVLLPPHFCSLLLTCWGDASFFFLGRIGGSCDKDDGEVNGKAAVEDLLDDLIHVYDPVVDCQVVFLLLTKAKPVLDANIEGVKDFSGYRKSPAILTLMVETSCLIKMMARPISNLSALPSPKRIDTML
jgi:hypothetical protein